MKTQTYDNHTRSVPGFHYFLVPLCFITLIGSIIYAVLSFLNDGSIFASVLFLALSLIVTISVFFLRAFVCKIQDRAIRSEENLRSFVLTGKLLDSRLTISQIIALRFADDEEFPDLCKKAVMYDMNPDDIKKTIQNWKADYYRV